MKLILKIIGQVIMLSIVLVFGIILIWEQLPGNRNICDAGSIYYVIAWFIFIITTIALLLNSWVFFNKQNWTKYRLIIITICISLIFTSFSIRWLIFQVSYNQEKYSFESTENSFQFIEIKLYENGKFYAQTYDMSCQMEHIGTYTIQENEITILFKNQKSKYIGTKYLMKNTTLVCLNNCNNTIEMNIK
ncbi:hypothetical protein [uncultured Kordia sp.]|uniref:hypothetical protein n=1 Tax=uncultured Kordia sp. TaxID=507699 RepID=UPI00261C097D|nr:hypothetical protein [uncultured Kordia sp.]